ncbi:hypothetical protein QRB38_11870 [Mycobacterium avium subsp. hominissuis]|nr:hypothetical protein [Mycobacterium avium subsp. hominissuis]
MKNRPRGRRADVKVNHRQVALSDALRDLPRAKCLRPDKVRYRSIKAADTAAEKQWLAARRVLYPYPCGDHYHLTSRRPAGVAQ